MHDAIVHRKELLEEIGAERERQILVCKHGGDTDKFDQGNMANDWVAYIAGYLCRCTNMSRNIKDQTSFRDNMIKVAALALAALESLDNGNIKG